MGLGPAHDPLQLHPQPRPHLVAGCSHWEHYHRRLSSPAPVPLSHSRLEAQPRTTGPATCTSCRPLLAAQREFGGPCAASRSNQRPPMAHNFGDMLFKILASLVNAPLHQGDAPRSPKPRDLGAGRGWPRGSVSTGSGDRPGGLAPGPVSRGACDLNQICWARQGPITCACPRAVSFISSPRGWTTFQECQGNNDGLCAGPRYGGRAQGERYPARLRLAQGTQAMRVGSAMQ